MPLPSAIKIPMLLAVNPLPVHPFEIIPGMNVLNPIRAAVVLILLWSIGASWAIELEKIETPASDHSLAPRLISSGDTVVMSWLEKTETGHRFMLAEFDGSDFGPARVIAEGSNFFANWADTPGIGIADDSTWLAHWLERSGRGTYAYDVIMAISRDNGQTWSEPFSPHDDGTLTEHGFVSTFPVPGSVTSLGAVWLDGRETQPAEVDQTHDHHHHHQGSGNMTLRTAVITREGAIEQPYQLDARVCDCCPTAAAQTDEGIIVVYRDRSDDEIRDISIIRQTDTGWSKPTSVHNDGWKIEGCPVNGPELIAQDQHVVVAWFTLADDVPRIHIARSTDSGRSFDPPKALDANIAMGRVGLAWFDQGYVLTWMAQQDSNATLRLAHFNADGYLLQQADLITLNQGRISGVPEILSNQNGELWLSWTEGRGKPVKPSVQFGEILLD